VTRHDTLGVRLPTSPEYTCVCMCVCIRARFSAYVWLRERTLVCMAIRVYGCVNMCLFMCVRGCVCLSLRLTTHLYPVQMRRTVSSCHKNVCVCVRVCVDGCVSP